MIYSPAESADATKAVTVKKRKDKIKSYIYLRIKHFTIWINPTLRR